MTADHQAAPVAPEANSSGDEAAKAKEAARLMAMKMLVITLGVILVALAVVVFSTLAIRAVKGGGQSASAPASAPALPGEGGARRPVQAVLPAGARVVSTTLGDGRLAVTAEGPDGSFVILFDARSLAETGRLQLAPAR